MIGYLASEYPAVSHTFIRREIQALRRRGLEIRTFAIRRPARGAALGESDRGEEAATGYLLPASLVGVAGAHMRALARSPGNWLRALGVALRNRPPGARAALWSLFYFAEAGLLAESLRAARVSHLHVHFAHAAADVARAACILAEIPWSLMLHGTADFEYPAVLTLADKLAAARFTVCASHFVRAQALRTIPPALWEKVSVVRCGVEIPETVARPAGSPPLRAVCVGRLSAEKGHHGLLAALAQLRGLAPDVRVTLIGDGPLRGELESRARELGLDDSVEFAGARPEAEVLRAVAGADLFVLPSLMEGLPVVLMEAMALGVPVLAPHVAGIPELVTDERDGLLFRPSDWQGLTSQLRRLLTDTALRTRLALAGRARVTGEFAIDRAVEPLWKSFAGRGD